MMKKGLIALLLTLPMLLTSCLGSSDSEPDPVAPGIAIYNAAYTRNRFALVPADAGMRLAMLLTEADKQELVENRLGVTVDGKSVKQVLFSNDAVITQNGTKYTIEFRKSQWYYYEGIVEVETNGVALDDDSAEWTITTSGLKAYINNGLGIVEYDYADEGKTLLYNDGGYYQVDLSDIRLSGSDFTLLSGWSGRFELNGPAATLAYSDCRGGEFKMNGSAQDDDLSWEAKNVRYKGFENTDTGQINGLLLAGEMNCAFVGNYSTEAYPSPKVKVEVSSDGKLVTITYNGVVVQRQG